MPQGRKDDNDRFIQAIASISAAPEPVTPLGRTLRFSEEGPLSAILTEIDETVLRRRLVFHTDRSDTLAIDVAERRLLLVHSVPTTMESIYSALLGKSLQDSQAREAFALLNAFAESASSVFVKSRLPQGDDISEFGGIPVQALKEQDNQQALPELASELSHAVEGSRAYAKALIVLENGKPVYRFGDRALCDTLEDRSTGLALPDLDRTQITLWSSGVAADGVLLVECEDTVIVIATFVETAAECFAVWQMLVTS